MKRFTGKRTAVVLLSAIASAMVSIGGADATSTLEQFDNRILIAHNIERARMGAPELRWNPELAADAEGWARRIAARRALMHSPVDPRDPDPQGENLWMGTRGYYTPEDMVGLWIAEKKHYRPGIFPAVSTTGDWGDIGHYTQVIWASTREVGCAVARNNEDDFLVCRYAEGGNVMGERPI